jgi:hypothetical protein
MSKNRYQIWGDNTGTEYGFQSYVNGYMHELKEAKDAFTDAKKNWKNYHHLELHQQDFQGNKIKTLLTFKRKPKNPQP